MGIPSFYRRLSIAHKGLIGKDHGTKTAALYFDFNCLIYTVARLPSMPTYSSEGHKEWEAALLNEIGIYIRKVWIAAGSPAEVFLSVDGVVPVAKIKQQRLRRFKSAWQVKEEVSRGIRLAGESWDTNAITPGTPFMDALGKKLQEICKKGGKGWTVSTSDEPGEGEHKIMQRLRSRDPASYDGSILIYGLDADLILLTMLNGVSRGFPSCYLMREDTEFGSKTGMLDEFSYLFMNKLPELIWKDYKALAPDRQVRRIQSYVYGMSLLGNDFLPHSLSIHVREDGHELLSRELQAFEVEGCEFLELDASGRLQVNLGSLTRILQKWAGLEEDLLLQNIRKKQTMRSTVVQVDPEQVLQALPLEWDVERECVIWRKQEDGKSRIGFLPTWKATYRQKWLRKIPLKDLTEHYIFGLQWIFDYYTGQRAVSMCWMYPSSLPPLWCDLVEHMPKEIPMHLSPPSYEIQPQQQLSMVLPLSSWYLVRNPKLRSLPFEFPQYWPSKFSFQSVGKRHLWECEPNICHLPITIVVDALKTV